MGNNSPLLRQTRLYPPHTHGYNNNGNVLVVEVNPAINPATNNSYCNSCFAREHCKTPENEPTDRLIELTGNILEVADKAERSASGYDPVVRITSHKASTLAPLFPCTDSEVCRPDTIPNLASAPNLPKLHTTKPQRWQGEYEDPETRVYFYGDP